MAELVIGKEIISYEVRQSSKAKKKRIVITPEKVEVIVPEGTSKEIITSFVEEKKNKVFTSRQKILEKLSLLENYNPAHYVSGAKILYRGRMMKLFVELKNVEEVVVKNNNLFYIFKFNK